MAYKDPITGKIELTPFEQLQITTHELVDITDQFETAVCGCNLKKIEQLAETLSRTVEFLKFDIQVCKVERELAEL